MHIALNIFLLLVGFALLIQSAKVFVGASVDIARFLKIPRPVIGLTVVAMGTSAPEFIISVSAAVGGSGNLAVANVVGSNIFNLLFIVGFCALLYPIATKMTSISRDYWVGAAATVALFAIVLIFNDTIPRFAAFILLAGFMVYMVKVVLHTMKHKVNDEDNNKLRPLWQSILLALLGIAVIIGAGQLTVFSAVNIAQAAGVTERIIGLTIIAMGTSLPELVTTIIACRKGEGEFALSFIIGSNIFNIMFVLGVSGLITPLAFEPGVTIDMAVLTVGTLAFFLLAYSGRRVVRFEGFAMVALYTGYMIWLIVN